MESAGAIAITIPPGSDNPPPNSTGEDPYASLVSRVRRVERDFEDSIVSDVLLVTARQVVVSISRSWSGFAHRPANIILMVLIRVLNEQVCVEEFVGVFV